MNREAVVALLKRKQGKRSLREFAVALGVSVAYLSDVYRGNREPAGKLLGQLGMRKVKVCKVTYERVADGD